MLWSGAYGVRVRGFMVVRGRSVRVLGSGALESGALGS